MPLRFPSFRSLFPWLTLASLKVVVLAAPPLAPTDLAAGFSAPPDSARPWVYLFPLDGNLTRAGITADLEAMRRVGIGGFIVMETDQGAPKGPARYGSPLWRELMQHLCREADRLGLKVNLHNAAGWTGSGGPWITPEQSMQQVVWSETLASGPQQFDAILPAPPKVRDFYRDIAVLAFPAPVEEGVSLATARPRVTTSTADPKFDGARVHDGDANTTVALPKPMPGKPQWLDLAFAEPFTVRTITLQMGWKGRMYVHGELQASDDGRNFRAVRQFVVTSQPLSLAVAATTARHFRLHFTKAHPFLGQLTIGEVSLSPRYVIDHIEGKSALTIEEFLPAAHHPDVPATLTIPRERLVELSTQMDATGRLRWEVPAGRWMILRFGHTSTGKENQPAPLEGRGLECDKLSREAVELSFQNVMAKLIDDNRALVGETRTVVSTHIDSWEVGSQNWTPRFREEFRRRRGYDLLPFLPALTGRVVGSLEISERFLHDVRQTVSDLVVDNYAGHFRTLARRHGLQLSIEAYDHAPTNDLVYANCADVIMTEFWAYPPPTGTPWREWCAEMASAAHVWGKPIVAAEAFTSMGEEKWRAHPATIKSLGDWAFSEGINRFVFHRYALQPWTNPDRFPGMSMGPWGLRYERTQTWWEQSRAWHAYLARCQFLLQQGLFVADIAYLAPEHSPQRWRPPVVGSGRPGYNFDGCPAEVVLSRMAVRGDRLVLPDGMSYRLLVLPETRLMTPALLRRIRDLVRDGATVVGARPVASPSLTDHPRCDEEVRALAQELWADCDGQRVKEHRFGRGRVVQGIAPEEVLAQLGIGADFSYRTTTTGDDLNYTHRSLPGMEVYFVANPHAKPVSGAADFRVVGRRPELWWPENGRREQPAAYDPIPGGTRLSLHLGPTESVFVIFRADTPTEANRVVAVEHDGRPATGQAGLALRRDARGKLEAQARAAGAYEIRTADGAIRRATLLHPPSPVELPGPWKVSFPVGWGAPDEVTLPHLVAWNEHADAGVRHFSGTATYSTRFTMPAGRLDPSLRHYLDLGRVAIMAEVRVNGRDCGVLWKPPFRVDVTGVLQEGTNELEVRVVNLWINRMIGDEQLPPDSLRRPAGNLETWPAWLEAGLPSPTGRFTFSSWQLWKKQDPLVESGLLGPARIESERVVTWED